jgi:formamidopyrimidine-DNA glycosylase
MPELPEVETIKNELLPYVLGRKIESLEIYWDRMVKELPVGEFQARVTGQTITGLSRRGKYLFFALGDGEVLVMHMKMTGSLIINPLDDRFTRAVFYLDDGTELHFWDPRKFGKMWLDSDEKTINEKLGPEPLDEAFTPEVLAQRLANRKAPVKPVVLDQSVIAGIGNMYADEALFDAKIHPLTPAGELSAEEIKRLHGSLIKVLQKALFLKGASVRNYIRPDGNIGTAHDEFNVAHGVGKYCPECGTAIERIVVRNRGTYFCPKCQVLPDKAE